MEATLGEEIFQEQMVVERPAIPANTELIICVQSWGPGMSIDLFIDRAERASSRSPHATPVSLDDWCVPGAERRATRDWREKRDRQDPSP